MDKPKKKGSKKTWLFLSFFIFISIAGCFFYSHLIQKQKDFKMGKRAVFVSKDPVLNFAFEYPEKGWTPRESQGRTEKYNVVYLSGPFDGGKRFTTLIEVVVKPLETGKIASELLDVFLKRIAGWPKFKVIRKKVMDIGGEKAFSAIYESEARLPVESLDAEPTMVGEQVIFAIKDNKSYRLSFHALVARWDDYLPVFKHLLKTFAFKDR